MKSLSPNAVPTDQQEVLITAICTGLVKVMLSTTLLGPPGPVTIGLNGTGIVLVPTTMTDTALQIMQAAIGSAGGVALQPSLEAIMGSVTTYMATNVNIVPTSGYGGQCLPPITMTSSVVYTAIFSALPATWQTNMSKSAHGLDFLQAIAGGLSAGYIVGVPGVIPFGTVPPPVGPLVAKFQ